MGSTRYLTLWFLVVILSLQKGLWARFLEDYDGDGEYNSTLELELSKPILLSAPLSITVALGESVTLPCDFQDLGEYVVLWKKDALILFASHIKVTRRENFHIVNETSLSISQVQPGDEGEYTCMSSTLPPIILVHSLSIATVPTEEQPTEWGQACPEMSSDWKYFGGKFCYLIETEAKVRWIKAERLCSMKGGTLASFHSTEDPKKILRYLKTSVSPLHIGLWKHSDGTFEWVDGSPVDFRNWYTGEPNDRKEMCVEMHMDNTKWNDIPCSTHNGYICQFRKGSASSAPLTKVCPGNSGKWLDLGGESCYLAVNDEEETWLEAAHKCHQEGGVLASLHSVSEISQIIKRFYKSDLTVHIGLWQDSAGTFAWLDRSPMGLSHWSYAEPNDEREKCSEMFIGSGRWNDIPCSKKNPYLCSTDKVLPGTPEQVPAGELFLPPSISRADVVHDPSNVTCGEELVLESGALQSPNYPENYNPWQQCVWRITVPENYQVKLEFKDFELEYGTDCEYDYVEVSVEGPTERGRLWKFCGSSLPEVVLSPHNEMTVRFVSDRINERRGFSAEFSAVEKCGADLVSDGGVIKSRNYPHNYLPNDACIWKITVEEGYRVELSIKSFNVEQGSDGNCDFDALEIRDGHDSTSASLGKFCGSNTLTDITSSGHKMTVKFTSDSSTEYYGFMAEFKTVSPANQTVSGTETPEGVTGSEGSQESGACGGRIVAEKGVLYSPNYPYRYPPNQRCSWTIEVPEEYGVVIRFKMIEIESASSCTYDYVAVKVLLGPNAPVLGRICGSNVPDPIAVPENKVTVVFRSDGSTEGEGFVALFEKVPKTDLRQEEKEEEVIGMTCGENFITEEGIIHSPNYPEKYGPSEKCVWKIVAPTDFRITLRFLSFEMEKQDRCIYDYVEIRDGPSSHSPLLSRMCGYDTPADIRSSRNVLRIEFGSDSTGQHGGFAAEFKREQIIYPTATPKPEQGPCGGIISSSSGSITSPNHPENYYPNTECIWNITVPEDKLIALKFDAFELESSPACQYDLVAVLESNGTARRDVGTFCGADPPAVIRSTTNELALKFITDGEIEFAGFSARFAAVDRCVHTVVAKSGIIQSPNFTSSEFGGRCIWEITTPEHSKINLQFLTLEMDEDLECKTDSVDIHIGHYPGQLSHLWGSEHLCGSLSNVSQSIALNASKATIIFTSDGHGIEAKFSVKFTSESCVEVIEADSGVIQSRGYPQTYSSREFCRWKITVPEHFQVVLRFEAFNIESSDSCEYDTVEVRDGHGDFSALLGTFCGTEIPHTIRSTTNKLMIEFSTDSSVQREGFKLTFTSEMSKEAELITALREFPSIIMQGGKQKIPKIRRPGAKEKLTSNKSRHSVDLQSFLGLQ